MSSQIHHEDAVPRVTDNGDIDPSFVITHRYRLAGAPQGYATFGKKEDDCLKVVMKP